MRSNFRNRIISGLAVAVPVAITIYVVLWIFDLLSSLLMPAVSKAVYWTAGKFRAPPFLTGYEKTIEQIIAIGVPVLSILLLIVLIYFIGVIAAGVVGKKLISLGERIVMRIPLVKSIYSASKQVITAFSLPDRGAFKAVVLVEFPRQGMKGLGFFIGMIEGPDGKKLAKVLIPNSPNPTTGFIEMLDVGQIQPVDITVEDAFKMILSGGIVGPDKFRRIDLPPPDAGPQSDNPK